MTVNSIIDFANGNALINFADSSSARWTGGTTLSIWNWDGTAVTGGGNDQLKFGTDNTALTSGQLAQISFYSGSGSGFLGTGIFATSNNGEVVFTAVPEPATIFGAFALVGMIGYRERKRLPFTRAARMA